MALLLLPVAPLCPLADAGLSSAWWPCCCPRDTLVCASRSWSSSWPLWGLGQTSTCHSSEWWGVGGPLSSAETPPHPASPQGQDVKALRTMTRAPARGSRGSGAAVIKCLPAPHMSCEAPSHCPVSAQQRRPRELLAGLRAGVSISPQPALPAKEGRQRWPSPRQGRGTENRIFY